MFRSICSAVQSFFSSSSTSTGTLPPAYSLAQLAVFPEENLTILEEVKDHPINFSCYGNLVVKVQEELFFKVQLSNEETKFLTKKKIVCTKDQAFNLHRNLSFQVQLSKVKPCHFQVVEKFQLFFAPENDHINSSYSHSDPISKNKKKKTNNNNDKKKMNQKQKEIEEFTFILATLSPYIEEVFTLEQMMNAYVPTNLDDIQLLTANLKDLITQTHFQHNVVHRNLNPKTIVFTRKTSNNSSFAAADDENNKAECGEGEKSNFTFAGFFPMIIGFESAVPRYADQRYSCFSEYVVSDNFLRDFQSPWLLQPDLAHCGYNESVDLYSLGKLTSYMLNQRVNVREEVQQVEVDVDDDTCTRLLTTEKNLNEFIHICSSFLPAYDFKFSDETDKIVKYDEILVNTLDVETNLDYQVPRLGQGNDDAKFGIRKVDYEPCKIIKVRFRSENHFRFFW